MSSPSEITNKGSLVTLAFEYAKAAHASVGQTRKYSGQDYIVHPLAVLQILVEAGETEQEVLAAALLHDVLEDVWPVNSYYSPDAILQLFGLGVTAYVHELTDEYTKEKYPEFNRAERKDLEARRISCISDGALRVKLADLIDNSFDITKHDPGFAKVYLQEKGKILSLLTPRVLDTKDPIILTLFHKAKTQVLYYETKR